MANELEIAYGPTGLTLYSVIRNSVGQVWNGTTFAAFNAANWTTYAVAMTEQGSTGYYVGTFPVVSAGSYNIETRVQAGGAAATTDALAGSGAMLWDGTQPVIIPNSAQFADKLLGRNNAGGSDGGRTVSQSMQTIRNKVVISGTTLTVYAEDDVTTLYVANLVTNAGAAPIISAAPTT